MDRIVPQTVSDKDWEDLRQAFKEKQERARAIEKLEAEERELKEKTKEGE
jgi:Tfp pilus assembly protein PilO